MSNKEGKLLCSDSDTDDANDESVEAGGRRNSSRLSEKKLERHDHESQQAEQRAQRERSKLQDDTAGSAPPTANIKMSPLQFMKERDRLKESLEVAVKGMETA